MRKFEGHHVDALSLQNTALHVARPFAIPNRVALAIVEDLRDGRADTGGCWLPAARDVAKSYSNRHDPLERHKRLQETYLVRGEFAGDDALEPDGSDLSR